MSHKIGYGEDIHRLKVGGKPLTILGIKAGGEKGVIAHSDGDAAFHALSDAILGAAGLGDIGLYFPPSDEACENLDSAEIVRYCLKKADEAGLSIVNADVTVMLEKPHLSGYREAMKENLAKVLGIEPSRVNVKFGTNEKLDAVGRGEAIRATAIISMEER